MTKRTNSSKALAHAVRLPVIARYCGRLWCVLAAVNTVPAAFAAACGDVGVALRYAAVIATVGTAGYLLGRIDAPGRMQRNEALVVSAIVFLSAPLLAVPAMTAAGLAPLDALFEAVSGATTTGLSVLATVEGKPPSFLFARAWMQWYGGLGIVVFGVALAMQPGPSTMTLSSNEAQTHDPVGGTKPHFRRIIVVYVALTVATVVLLIGAGAGGLDALAYAFASVSTGGFATHDDSLAALPAAARWVALLACTACALSLVFYHTAWRDGLKGLKRFARDPQLRAFAASVAMAATLIAWTSARNDDAGWGAAIGRGVTMALSAQTTAGFSTVDTATMSPASKLVLIGSMFVGGGTGSTAGGVKLLRLLVLFALVRRFVVRASMPQHAVVATRLAGRRVDDGMITDAAMLAGAYVSITAVSWYVFVVAGHDPLDSLFEVVSALGTVGLSAGVSAPELSGGLKLVLCADMLLGRLEILAWLVMVYPGTWLGKRAST